MPILTYHYLSENLNPRDILRTGLSVAPAVFDAECRFLVANGYTTITLDDFLAAREGKVTLPARPVILTFDDGYEDFYTNAYPILQRYHLQATIYIITDKVGQPGYMTWLQLRELAHSPLITVGAHTRTHPALDVLSPRRQRDEIVGSKSMLEDQLHIAVDHFCYPYGRYSASVVALVRQAGFLTATTTHRRIASSADDPFLLPRIEIVGGTTLTQFRASLLPPKSSLVGHTEPHRAAGQTSRATPSRERSNASPTKVPSSPRRSP